jgi:hypothetical protein
MKFQRHSITCRRFRPLPQLRYLGRLCAHAELDRALSGYVAVHGALNGNRAFDGSIGGIWQRRR